MPEKPSTAKHSPLYYLVRPLSTVFLGSVAFCFFLLFTEYGAKTTFRLVSELSPFEISAQSFSGNLAYHFSAQDLKLVHGSNMLSIEEINVHWHPMAIFDKKAHIKNLEAHGVKLLNKDLIDSQVLNDAPLEEYADLDIEDIESFSIQKVQELIKDSLPFEVKIEAVNLTNASISLDDKHTFNIQKLAFDKANTHQLTDLQTFILQSDYGVINADFRDNIDITWQLKIPNVQLPNNLTGNLKSQGNILLPKASSEENGSNESIALTHLEANLALSNLSQNQALLESLSFQVKGDAANHDGTLVLVTEKQVFNTKFEGRYTPNHWTAKVSDWSVFDKKFGKLPKSKGEISLRYQDSMFSVDSHFSLFGNNPIENHFVINPKKPYDMTGSTHGDIHDLKFLTVLFPAIESLQGTAVLDFKTSGTFFSPIITGETKFSKVKVQPHNFDLAGYVESLTLRSKANGQISLVGNGIFGNGPFHLEGNANLLSSPLALDLKFTGNNLVVSDTAEYYILTSPELRLTLEDGEPHLSGKIFIPKADINAPAFEDNISPSEDVVFVSKTQKPIPKTETPSSFGNGFHTDLTLELGDEIRFTGFNLDTHIAGSLHIASTPNETPTAKGQLHFLEGKYKVYGKTLNINYGQILFTGGAINNPSLDILAERKIEPPSQSTENASTQTITAGVNITGTLKSPLVKMTSTPTMPDSDVISYLLLGQPQNKASQAQNQMLFQAASNLATFLGKKHNQNNLDIGAKLKLDEFGLSQQSQTFSDKDEHSPLEDTVLVLGKQLSKRLYLHYSVGIVDSVSNLSARYQLNKHVTLQASGGTKGSGADLLFQFESS